MALHCISRLKLSDLCVARVAFRLSPSHFASPLARRVSTPPQLICFFALRPRDNHNHTIDNSGKAIMIVMASGRWLMEIPGAHMTTLIRNCRLEIKQHKTQHVIPYALYIFSYLACTRSSTPSQKHHRSTSTPRN